MILWFTTDDALYFLQPRDIYPIYVRSGDAVLLKVLRHCFYLQSAESRHTEDDFCPAARVGGFLLV